MTIDALTRDTTTEIPLADIHPYAGRTNPVIRIINSKATYLWYDAIGSYTSPAACTSFIRCQNPPGSSNIEDLFDPITARFMKRVVAPVPQHGITEGYELQKEEGARRGITTRPYMVGVLFGEVFGGVWQDYDLNRARKNRLRVAVFHISVDQQYKRLGLGTDMLRVYTDIMRSKRSYDGIACLFDNDEEHSGTAQFFERNGFEVTNYGLNGMYSQALLMFTEPEHAYNPRPSMTAAGSNTFRSPYPCPVPR